MSTYVEIKKCTAPLKLCCFVGEVYSVKKKMHITGSLSLSLHCWRREWEERSGELALSQQPPRLPYWANVYVVAGDKQLAPVWCQPYNCAGCTTFKAWEAPDLSAQGAPHARHTPAAYEVCQMQKNCTLESYPIPWGPHRNCWYHSPTRCDGIRSGLWIQGHLRDPWGDE